MIKKPDLVLIDLDGTLIDSVPDLTYCIDEMMKRLDRPVCGEDEVRNWVGNGVERLVQRALTGTLDGDSDKALLDQAYPIFLELYAENTSQRSTLYPGVIEGLNFLKDNDYHLGCITNKAEQFTIPLLKEKNIYDYFALVVCGDTLDKKKPDPAPLIHAARYFRVEPTDCLMVGDSVSDVKAARAAGFQIVCMPYGYNHGNDIRDENPDLVIDSLAQLGEVLEG
ncbi:MAG: phosphoglycolate phosphatase [Gammaproteobacteria bacterium]|nr:phosphoglycolate phosphatase [Gammaproteobacteria bacterium]